MIAYYKLLLNTTTVQCIRLGSGSLATLK